MLSCVFGLHWDNSVAVEKMVIIHVMNVALTPQSNTYRKQEKECKSVQSMFVVLTTYGVQFVQIKIQ